MQGTSLVTRTRMVLSMWNDFGKTPTFTGAVCDTRNGYDPELWFPDAYEQETRELIESAAIALCWTCDNRQQCLDFALDENIRHGIWGGFTAAERKVISQDRAANV